MRHGFLIAGLLLIAAPTQAADHPRSTYVTLVLQAFAAKVECPNTDVALSGSGAKGAADAAARRHHREGAQGDRLHAYRRQRWARSRTTT